MSKRKKYNPNKHKVDKLAYMRVVSNSKLLTEVERMDLWKKGFKALNGIQFDSDVSRYDFSTLCDVVNMALLLTEVNIGKEYLPDLKLAREGMQRAKDRFMQSGKLRFDASGLEAIKQAFVVHQAQLEVCTYGEFVKAYNEQKKRIDDGYFYKAEDMKVAA